MPAAVRIPHAFTAARSRANERRAGAPGRCGLDQAGDGRRRIGLAQEARADEDRGGTGVGGASDVVRPADPALGDHRRTALRGASDQGQ